MAKSAKQVISKSMSFRICVYPSQYDKSYFTAHCLELDIFGQDKTVEGAVGELLQLIENQIEVCEETGAVWQKYERAKKAKHKLPDELIDRIISQANRHLGFVEPLNIGRRIDYIVGTKEVMDECQAALA